MKFRLALCIVALGISTRIPLVSAQVSPTPDTKSPTPSGGAKVKQIEDLKDRLATKVAELRNLQRKAIAGKVKSQTVSSMTIETNTKDIKIELTDSIKIIQYLKGKRSTLTIDDVDNGDKVVVFGQYDSTIDILKTSLIIIDNSELQVRISGTVQKLDEEEFTMTVTAPDGIGYIIDIEKSTKTLRSEENSLVKSGFSKISIGDTVHIVGTEIPKQEKRLSALRIIDLGSILPFTKPEPSPTEEISTPTRSANPKAKPSPTP